MKIGEQIRKYRKEKRMTLEELSSKSGVALATLSRMETGKMSGTLKSHTSICKALGISIAELYREIEDSSKTIESVASGKAPERMEGSGKVKYELLIARTGDKRMLPVILKIATGAGTQIESNRPGAERFLYVLKGAVDIEISGKKYALKKGDSLYFDSSLKHSFRNTSAGEAEIISITSQQR